MKSPIIYCDTSFFIGLLDNVSDREEEAIEILRYEKAQGSRIYTSIMTLNEFITKTYNKFHDHHDCEDEVAKAIYSIRDLAEIYAFNEDVAKGSARLLSVWGRFRRINTTLPRDKKFRWDSIHLATANILKADRVYSWDESWNDFPKEEIPDIKSIISPAKTPQANLFI